MRSERLSRPISGSLTADLDDVAEFDWLAHEVIHESFVPPSIIGISSTPIGASLGPGLRTHGAETEFIESRGRGSYVMYTSDC